MTDVLRGAKMVGRKLRGATLLLALSVMPVTAPWADTDIYFSGTVTAPMPCVINGKQMIMTYFGDDLITTHIDGRNYRKELSYGLVCNGSSKNALRMKVLGDVTGFNQHALQTDLRDLGVELSVNDQPLAINTWFNFTYLDGKVPVLKAVPVKRVGQSLPVGTFFVNAMMVVDYQ